MLPSAVPRSPPPAPVSPLSAPPSPSQPPGLPRYGSSRPPLGATASATAQLEQRLGAAQIELRKLSSERHTLRARLRRAVDRAAELESALRAEKELRRQLSDEHHGAMTGLRARLSELEVQRDDELARLREELARTQREAASAVAAAEAAAAAALAQASPPAPPKAAKPPQGLRRIRGIGPAYQRVLEQLGITRVEQVAAWSEADVAAFADKLKIKRERITKDDWVGQARRLEPESE